MSLVEKRYAQALVDIAVESNKVDFYKDCLQKVSDIFKNSNELRAFLVDPRLKVEVKKSVLEKIFADIADSNILNFLFLLLDKRRIKYLPAIVNEYFKLADEEMNVLNMTIISATPLSESQINAIKEKYRRIYKANYIKAQVEVDAEMLGGIMIRIGDKIIDFSVRTNLQNLLNHIVQQI